MKKYDIVKINCEGYKIMIFSKSYETPFSFLNKICEDLQNLDLDIVQGKVIFDMLLNIGNTSERFVEAYFDGKELNDYIYLNISKSSEIRKISSNYYMTNTDLLRYSALNSVQIKMIKKGIVI